MTRRNFPHDKPTAADFKTFWSVFEAKQQRKREQLNQLQLDVEHLKDDQ
jgi:hypothetical protein